LIIVSKRTYSFNFGDNATDPLISELPDIEGDSGFQMLRENDREIDAKLNTIFGIVTELKEGARAMGQEADKHSGLIDDATYKVDRAVGEIQNLNKRLKETLQKVRRADRFCIDIILVVVILGIGAYLYNVFTNGGF